MEPRIRRGRGSTLQAPTVVPPWLKEDLFAGTLAFPVPGNPEQSELIVRSAAKAGPGGKGGIVVVDVPIDDQ